ncbi:MAG: ABC transporter ATP-binding protein [Actinomycetota bacterium]|nr:ABC transporter ATP-binding protein [Actinomycetota bacterium]
MTLAVTDLVLRRGPAQILHGVCLTVTAGEVVCLAGPNGAGKSSLLDVVAGLHPLHSGQVEVLGSPAGSDAAKRLVGALPAAPPLYDQLSAREHLQLLARLWGLSDDRVDEVVASLDLGSLLEQPAGQMSLGQRQRLALGVVTLHGPRLLLLDEPFNGLDAGTTALLRDVVADCAAGGGVVLVATHLLDVLDGLATRLVYLHEGRVLHDVPVPLATHLSELTTRFGVEYAPW